jgi:hypothetical protein
MPAAAARIRANEDAGRAEDAGNDKAGNRSRVFKEN